MPTNTQTNHSLLLTLGTVQVECQVIDLSFSPPGMSASTVTEVACPGGKVAEPGSISTGTLTGNVFTDSQDTGVTWILAQARNTDAVLTYSLTLWADLGPTVAMKYTGDCRVNGFTLTFEKPGLARHGLDLEVTTAALARPAAETMAEAA